MPFAEIKSCTSTWLKRAINTSFERRELYVSADSVSGFSFYGSDLAQVVNHDPTHLPSPLSSTSPTCPRNCRNWKTLTRGVFTQPKCCCSAKIKSIRAFKVNKLHHSSSRPLHNVSLPDLSLSLLVHFLYVHTRLLCNFHIFSSLGCYTRVF